MADGKDKVLPYVNAGPTRVTLTIQDGQKTLPMLQHGTKLYVVAVPDEEFQVHVLRVDNDFYQPGIRVCMKVDGECIGYARSLLGNVTKFSFTDYLGAPGAAPGELTRFKFQPVAPTNQATATVVNNPDEIKSGRIQVTIHALSQNLVPSASLNPGPRAQSSPVTLPDGKKFFMAPSLRCGQGASSGAVTWATQRYESANQLGTVELHYETVATLMLRKVLVPTVPEHKRIIDEFGLQAATEATDAAGGVGPSSKKRQRPAAHEAGSSKSARKSSKPSNAVEVRADTAVKPEPGAGTAAAGQSRVVDLSGTDVRPAAAAGPPLVVDLTGDGPLVVNGKELRKNQLAVCDLTMADGGKQQQGGAWQVMDKVKEEVVLD